MGARNKKVREGGWPGFRGALGWVAGKLKSGVLALGVQGALVVALLVAAAWGLHAARREAARLPQFCIYPDQLRAQAPPWCAEDLAQVTFPRDSYSIFDTRLTRDVAEAYLASPWVKAVRRVEKRFPNQLALELDLREPAAFVHLPDACYAVDAEGIYLPLDSERWNHAERPLPCIFGVRTEPPAPGKRWDDAGAIAALSVLRALAAEPALVRQVHFVDVSNLDGQIDPQRSEVLLFTNRRVRIAWGRPPNSMKFGEPSVACKLARLRRCLSRPATLSEEPTSIDLRFPDDESALVRTNF